MQFEVLTNTGFSKFGGVIKRQPNKIYQLICENGHSLKCTHNHRLLNTSNEFQELSQLSIGDIIYTDKGYSKICSIDYISDDNVYDLLDVHNGNCYYTNGILSHNCSFLGSSNTLIAGWKLQQLTFKTPIETLSDKHWSVYEPPKTNNSYCMTVDVSEGLGQDYAVVSVFDVTAMPYKLVAVYRNNLIQPVSLTEVAFKAGTHYNNAYALIENNSIGKIVADSLFFDFEYENLFRTTSKHGETDIGFGGHQPGIRTTSKTKALGCAQLKSLIESNSLIVEDFTAVSELSTFAIKGKSYAAEKGKTDDVVMTLVLFAWFTAQPYFSDMFDVDVRKQLRDTMDIDSNIGFMFIDDGVTDYEGLDTFG